MMCSVTRLIALVLLACLTLLTLSCESEDTGPADSASGLPWNRPLPGERSGAMGAMPFQSH
jgi:hypothetical protein